MRQLQTHSDCHGLNECAIVAIDLPATQRVRILPIPCHLQGSCKRRMQVAIDLVIMRRCRRIRDR